MQSKRTNNDLWPWFKLWFLVAGFHHDHADLMKSWSACQIFEQQLKPPPLSTFLSWKYDKYDWPGVSSWGGTVSRILTSPSSHDFSLFAQLYTITISACITPWMPLRTDWVHSSKCTALPVWMIQQSLLPSFKAGLLPHLWVSPFRTTIGAFVFWRGCTTCSTN